MRLYLTPNTESAVSVKDGTHTVCAVHLHTVKTLTPGMPLTIFIGLQELGTAVAASVTVTHITKKVKHKAVRYTEAIFQLTEQSWLTD